MTASSAAQSPSSVHLFFRPSLRQATLILPQTGQRVKRSVTLQDPDAAAETGQTGDGPADDRTPLLRTRSDPSARPYGFSNVWRRTRKSIQKAQRFALSETGKGVLKCSLAYLLGSLATFVPAIAALLGQQDGKHLVATITVYFHPARSRGSMYEASILASVAFLYAAFISVTSMGLSRFFADTLDLRPLGHVIVLVVFCGGGLGYVGWVKQSRGDPLVNVACSLTSLAIITVLTKEGAVQAGELSFDKILQVLKMVIIGVLATMAVCFLIFPISAKKKLRQNMIDITDSLADELGIIAHSFLSGFEEELEQGSFIEASDRHKKAYASLGKNLKEAKYEHYVMGTEKEYHIEAKLVHCVQRVTQSIGGLRSAATMQFSLLKEPTEDGGTTPVNGLVSPPKRPGFFSSLSSDFHTFQEDVGVLPAIDEIPEDENTHGVDEEQSRRASVDDDGSAPTVQSAAEIFSRFISQFGPSMKSLAYTLREILDELPYGPSPDFKITINSKFRTSLVRAVDLYKASRHDALKLVYRQKDMNRIRPLETEADFEEVAASCGHFSFSLQEFAGQLQEYLDVLDELQLEVEERPNGRSWQWLKFWHTSRTEKGNKELDPELASLIDHAEDLNLQVLLPNSDDRKTTTYPDPEKTPSRTKVGYRIWRALRVLRRDDIKFAIKVGIGAALYAAPSFINSTRPIYAHWRGEWGLLSYMLVCSMTIGASNTTGYSRFLGTCLGAVCAIVAWNVSSGMAIPLAFLGWFMAFWTAYIIVAQGKGPMGRFIMLTYNLSALYAYSLSVKDDDHDEDEGGTNPIITAITAHRVVAVLSGCLWGLVVTRLIWPISARQKLKDGLSLLWLRMGLIWKRDPVSMLLEVESPNAYMNIREEFGLQRFMSQLENLRKSAKSEFELRGPFPDSVYGKILESNARMLDAFHAMNVVILKDLTASEGEAALLRYTIQERAQLCSRISHLFSVLASSMKLEYPLIDALPNTEHARDRLLARIFCYRKNDEVSHITTDEDFALLYAYALVTGQLSKEIKEVIKEVENLFGVLNEDLLKLQ